MNTWNVAKTPSLSQCQLKRDASHPKIEHLPNKDNVRLQLLMSFHRVDMWRKIHLVTRFSRSSPRKASGAELASSLMISRAWQKNHGFLDAWGQPDCGTAWDWTSTGSLYCGRNFKISSPPRHPRSTTVTIETEGQSKSNGRSQHVNVPRESQLTNTT